MFQVINLNQEVERECPTRAELMYFLEGEEKRCLSTNTSETFRLLHFDRNGEVLEAKEITIPPSGEDKELKDLLADFVPFLLRKSLPDTDLASCSLCIGYGFLPNLF